MLTCDYYGSVFLRENVTPPGVAQTLDDERRTANVGATLVNGVLNLQPAISNLQSEIDLLDACGRTVTALHPGANDVSTLSPGVYFVREEPQAVRKVVIAP
jgi:hypothetical protein